MARIIKHTVGIILAGLALLITFAATSHMGTFVPLILALIAAKIVTSGWKMLVVGGDQSATA